MKSILKHIFLPLFIVLVLTLNVFAVGPYGLLRKQHAKQYLANYKSALNKMSHHMEHVPITGNVNEDFLLQMLPYHEASLALSKNILNYTHDEEIRALAESIALEETKHLDLTKKLLETLKAQSPSKANDSDYMKTYYQLLHTMSNQMYHASFSNDVNIDFLNGIIPHHEGGISLAKNVLKYTSNPQIQKLAQSIITKQSIHLEDMKNLLNR